MRTAKACEPTSAALNDLEPQFAAGASALGANLETGVSTTIGIYRLPDLLATAPAPGAGACPRVTIANSANSADVANAVAQFKVDCGLIELSCHAPDLQAEPCLRDELIIVATPGDAVFQVAHGELVKRWALREARWRMREPGSGTREAFDQALLPHPHYPINADPVFHWRDQFADRQCSFGPLIWVRGCRFRRCRRDREDACQKKGQAKQPAPTLR